MIDIASSATGDVPVPRELLEQLIVQLRNARAASEQLIEARERAERAEAVAASLQEQLHDARQQLAERIAS